MRRHLGFIARLTTVALVATGLTVGHGAGVISSAAPPAKPDPAADYLADERGISQAEAMRRISWQQQAPGLDEELRTAMGPDQYGGMWIDIRDGDRIKVGLVEGSSGSGAAVVTIRASARKVADAVDIVPVRYSERELTQAGELIAAKVHDVNENAPSPLQVTVWRQANAVELRLPGADPLTEPQRRLVQATRNNYGDMIRLSHDATRVFPAACTNDEKYCDPPLRAGIRIHTGNSLCTLAFLARSVSDSKLYAITAGHCSTHIGQVVWTRFATRDRGTHVLGPVHNRRFSVQTGDMAIIRIENEAGWMGRAWVFVLASSQTARDEQYPIRADATNVEGQRVCATGITTGSNCGVVTRVQMPGENARSEATYCSRPGDSGGPVYASNTAFGIIVGTTGGDQPCRSYHLGVRYIESQLRVSVSHDAG